MTIAEAIGRSLSHAEQIHVDYSGTTDDLFAAIRDEWDGDFDSSDDGSEIDVWGIPSDDDTDRMAWRIHVRLVEEGSD